MRSAFALPGVPLDAMGVPKQLLTYSNSVREFQGGVTICERMIGVFKLNYQQSLNAP